MDATGANGERMAIAGRLRQLASEARDERTAVNGGKVRYQGGSAAAAVAGIAVLPADDWANRRLSDGCVTESAPGWLTSVRADRDADLPHQNAASTVTTIIRHLTI